MLLYNLFWMFMGFIMHFYIIFGTNLLTQSPVPVPVFFSLSVFRRKGISNGVQTEWNLREKLFLERKQSRRLGVYVREATRWPWGREARLPPWARPHPRGPLVAPPTYFFLLHIPMYPETIEEHHQTLFTPPQPSVPVRSHLGAFFGAPPEGESITEGFYINTMASPMMRE